MPTTEDGKKTGSAARAEQSDTNQYVSQDTFDNPAMAELTNTATATDPQGIERIVQPVASGFVPAALTATDEQKAHMETFNGKLEEAKETRLAALKPGEDPSNEERVVNEPGNAGSQTGVTSASVKTGTSTTESETKGK